MFQLIIFFQARIAQQSGADYIGVGPVFPTTTKDYEPPVGLDYLRQVKKETTILFVAIGGINFNNIHKVLHAGEACCHLFCNHQY